MKFLKIAILSYIVSLSINSAAIAGDSYKHAPKIETSGKLGNKRDIGDGKITAPLWQNKDGKKLVFGDFRGRFDNLGSSEFNLGLGYRQLIDYEALGQDQWIIGGYSFIDRLNSRYDNTYKQITIGIEALSEKYDFRANLYLPEDNQQDVNNSGRVSQTALSNFIIEFDQEKAYDGFDVEFGYKLPTNVAEVKIFGGYFYFDESGINEVGYQDISGPKIRGEVLLNEYHSKYIPKNVEVGFGFEYQSDEVFGDQIFGVAKISYSFGSNGFKNKGNDLRSRMTEFAIRDIDIRSTAKTFKEDALILVNGRTFENAIVLNANDEGGLENAFANATDGTLIVLDGDSGEFTLSEDLNLVDNNQFLVGGGVYEFVAANNRSIISTHNIGSGSNAVISSNDGNIKNINLSGDNLSIHNIDFQNIKIDASAGVISNLVIENSNFNSTNPFNPEALIKLGAINNARISNATINSNTFGIEIEDSFSGNIDLENIVFSNEYELAYSVGVTMKNIDNTTTHNGGHLRFDNVNFVTHSNLDGKSLFNLGGAEDVNLDRVSFNNVNSLPGDAEYYLIDVSNIDIANIENLSIDNSNLEDALINKYTDFPNHNPGDPSIDYRLNINNLSGGNNALSQEVCDGLTASTTNGDDFFGSNCN